MAGPDEIQHLDEAWATLQQTSPRGRRLSAAEALAMVPALRPEKVTVAVYEPDSFDMDVHAIHQGYLRGFKHAGGTLVCDAEVVAIERAGVSERHGLQKTTVAVQICSVTKADMMHNSHHPKMEIDPQRYAVRADGQFLTCEPASQLPMVQRYFSF